MAVCQMASTRIGGAIKQHVPHRRLSKELMKHSFICGYVKYAYKFVKDRQCRKAVSPEPHLTERTIIMRNLLKASLVFMAVGAVSTSSAHAYEDEECSYRVSGVGYNDVLNIRRWPSPKSRIVGYIPPNGEGVELIRRKGRWGLIFYEGTEGWSHMGYLRSDCD